MNIKTRAPKLERSLEVDVDIPEDLNGLVSAYGEGLVTSSALASIRVNAQNFVRTMMENGKTDDEIEEAMLTWTPEAKAERGVTSIISKVDKMTEEEKAILREKLGL